MAVEIDGVINKIITDDAEEKIIAKWDRERLAILRFYKKKGAVILNNMIVFNPREMRELIEFIESCLKGE